VAVVLVAFSVASKVVVVEVLVAVARAVSEGKEEPVVELPLALCFITSTRLPWRTTLSLPVTEGEAATVAPVAPVVEGPPVAWERLVFAPYSVVGPVAAAMVVKAAAAAAAVSAARVAVAGVGLPSESWWGRM